MGPLRKEGIILEEWFRRFLSAGLQIGNGKYIDFE
jgi:hypothetical protein